MPIYSHNGNTPAPLPFRIRLSDGRLRTDPATFTDAEIADAGYEAAPDKPTVQPWQQAPQWDAGAWAWTIEDRPLADVIAERVRKVEQRHDAVLDGGFAYDFGAKVATLPDGTTETAGVRTLQTRPGDRERWQATMQVAQQYIMAGNPAEPMRPFRTQDDAMVPMTAQDVAGALNAMQAFFGRALDALWAHKDAIRQLDTVAAVVAYDIETGWP